MVEASGTGDSGDQRGRNWCPPATQKGACSIASRAGATAWKENERKQCDRRRKEKKIGDMGRGRGWIGNARQ